MDKIKKSVGLKCAAAVVLIISLIALVVSSVFACVCVEEGAYRPQGREFLYQDRVESIASDYTCKAVLYYERIAELTYEGKTDEEIASATRIEREMFSEEHTNYSFTITPVYAEDREVYPTLTNYVCDDSQYEASGNMTVTAYAEGLEFSFHINLDDIYDELYKRVADKEAFREAYLAEDYYFYFDGNDIWVDMGGIPYCLSENEEYETQWLDFCMKSGSGSDTHEIQDITYDGGGAFRVDVIRYVEVPVIIEMRVKSSFTAEDDFAQSLFLRYMDVVVDATIPVLIVSLLLVIVCSVYLISAAGHRRNADGITLNMFDRIPYDILLAVLFFGAVGIIYGLDGMYSWYSSVQIVLFIAAGVLGVALIPPLMMTTATRIKFSEWALFKNTIIYRAMRLAWRCIRAAGSWAVRSIRYLFCHLNIYWKYLGVWFGLGLIALIAMSSGSYEAVACVGFLGWLAVCVLMVRGLADMNALKKGAQELAAGNTAYEIDTSHMMWEFKSHGENLNRISDGIQAAVEERMKSERMKTELITNVSHDIKTPLTSIISYVDLLGKEELQDVKAKEYVEVLERQSARLKKLIQDLIDASKASTGNLPVNIENMDVKVLLEQAMGEFSEKMEKRGLKTIITYHTDPVLAKADGKLLWRTFENLINNITKYAQDNTRVYIDVDKGKRGVSETADFVSQESVIQVTFKNISREALNLSGEELMERFVRGDSSRNTEGSGLGLSIAKSLMELQNGELEIIVDGDLFKVVLLLVRA